MHQVVVGQQWGLVEFELRVLKCNASSSFALP